RRHPGVDLGLRRSAPQALVVGPDDGQQAALGRVTDQPFEITAGLPRRKPVGDLVGPRIAPQALLVQVADLVARLGFGRAAYRASHRGSAGAGREPRIDLRLARLA